jgi:hypothetical protein
MKRFKEWLLENTLGTDEVVSQIDALYDKAKYAIKLVQMYSKATNKGLLKNISTVAPLHSGVYGLYNSSENKKVVGAAASNKIRFKFGQDALSNARVNRLANVVIKQYLPDIDERQIIPSDVIHVNVRRIVSEMGDTPRAIIEIASTIVHEATHEIEFQSAGKTDENGPKKAEAEFQRWVSANWRLASSKIPQLNF